MTLNSLRYRILSPAKQFAIHVVAAVFVGMLVTVVLFWVAGQSMRPSEELVGAEAYTNLEGYASLLNVAITVISVGIAWGLFAQAEASRRLNRKADVIISCIDRYERLSDFESQFGKDGTPEKASHHFSQYFALKSDQVDFYLAGWIDSDTFITWMRAMLRSWIKKRLYFGVTIADGWSEQSQFHADANSIFHQLMLGIEEIVARQSQLKESARAAYVEAAFQHLIIVFYDRTRAARRLLATDFEPARYFATKPLVFDEALRRRLRKFAPEAAVMPKDPASPSGSR